MTKYPTSEKAQEHDELTYRINISIAAVAVLGFLLYALITS